MYNDLNEYISSPVFNAIENITSDDVFIYIKNPESKYIFLSKNICKLSNIVYQQAIGKGDNSFKWGKKQAKAFIKDDLYVLNYKKSHVSKYLIPNGEDFLWVKTEKVPILDKNNKVIGILGIAQDISYKKMLVSQQPHTVKTSDVANQTPEFIVRQLIEQYIVKNYRNEHNVYDEFTVIKNSFINKLSNELLKKANKPLVIL